MATARLHSIALAVPGDPIDPADLPLSEAERKRLPRLGQRAIHRGGQSDALMIEAAARCLEQSGRTPADIGLVITAPSLLTAHGLGIPAVAVRAGLGLRRADTLNVQQGCNGVLKALDLATDRLAARPGRGDVLVVAGCMASTLTVNSTHGSFFWSDGAGAALVSLDDGPGYALGPYVEESSPCLWDAMRVPFGDACPLPEHAAAPELGRITVSFPDLRAQADYIQREARMVRAILDGLLAGANLGEEDVAGIALPAFGANRVPMLLSGHPILRQRVLTDFTRGHMGGVDILATLRDAALAPLHWVAALTASFTAQWGGMLLRRIG